VVNAPHRRCRRSPADAALFAFGSLPPLERLLFARHLRGCPVCRGRVAEAGAVADALAAGVPQPPLADPAALTERIVRRALRERPSGRRRAAAAVPVQIPVRATAAVLSALLLANALLAWHAGRLVRTARTALAQQSASLAVLQGALQDLAGGQTVALRGTPAAPGALAHVTVQTVGGRRLLMLVAGGLPVLSGPAVYQLWLIAGAVHTSAGVFTVDASGRGALAAWIPAGRSFAALGVTRQGAGPAVAPSGTRVLGGAPG